MKRLILIFLHFIFCIQTLSAQDSCDIQISLLTCGPGDELYASFGHTGIRVRMKDSTEDYVFNYGTFEFEEGFYSKFIKGSLLYYLSVENYDEFVSTYQTENRSVTEQVLQLSCEEKHQLFLALQQNADPINRYYKYDFLYDNCTTRAKNIIFKNSMMPIRMQAVISKPPPSFRKLIHEYLDAGKKYWSKLGIDLLLGANVDKKVTNEQALFLPEYLMKGVDHSYRGSEKLSTTEKIILPNQPSVNSFQLTPFILFSIILIGIIILSFNSHPAIETVVRMFDILLFLVTGIAGILMLTLWLIREDEVCRMNYNLIWALPTNFIMAFFVPIRNRKIVSTYYIFIFYVTLIFLLTWYLLPQQFNLSLIPIWILIAYRSWSLSKPNQNGRKNNLL